jgi:hypothetical protein
MSAFYMDQLASAPEYGDLIIDVAGYTEDSPYSLGPIRVNGNLKIMGDGVARLDGPIFGIGEVKVMPGVTVMLNDQTMYTESVMDVQPGATLVGSGALISSGDLAFQPSVGSSPYLFLMSIEGSVSTQPSGDFYGSAAGYSGVSAQPGSHFVWSDYPEGLNLPITRDHTIVSWQHE